jgi:hypothetical protein
MLFVPRIQLFLYSLLVSYSRLPSCIVECLDDVEPSVTTMHVRPCQHYRGSLEAHTSYKFPDPVKFQSCYAVGCSYDSGR